MENNGGNNNDNENDDDNNSDSATWTCTIAEANRERQEQMAALADADDVPDQLVQQIIKRKPKVYESEYVRMTAFIQQVMMFRREIELEQLFELMLALFSVSKCIKIFENPAKLLDFIDDRCRPLVTITVEESSSEKRTILRWNDPVKEGKKRGKAEEHIMECLIGIGEKICTREEQDDVDDEDGDDEENKKQFTLAVTRILGGANGGGGGGRQMMNMRSRGNNNNA